MPRRTDFNRKSDERTGVEGGGAGALWGMLAVTVAESSAAHTLLVVSGILDQTGAEKLLAKLDRLLDQGRRHLVLDLGDVTFCDSSGVSALVRGHARASSAAGGLRISVVSDQVRRVLEISGLTRMFGLATPTAP